MYVKMTVKMWKIVLEERKLLSWISRHKDRAVWGFRACTVKWLWLHSAITHTFKHKITEEGWHMHVGVGYTWLDIWKSLDDGFRMTLLPWQSQRGKAILFWFYMAISVRKASNSVLCTKCMWPVKKHAHTLLTCVVVSANTTMFDVRSSNRKDTPGATKASFSFLSLTA